MRQHDDARMILQSAGGEIADIGLELAGLQRLEQRFFVHHPLAREVQHGQSRPDVFQELGVDQVAGGIVQRDVQGDEIGLRGHFVDAQHLLDLRGELPGVADGDVRVVTDYPHPQRAGGVGDPDADGAQTDHTQGAVGQFGADELLLAGFDLLGQFGVAALQLAGIVPGGADVARRQQHAGDDQFLDGIGVGAGRIEHANALGGHLGHRDVVDTGPGPAYRLEAGGNGPVVHLEGSQQHGVGVLDFRGDLVTVAREAFQAGNADVVEGQDFVHGRVTIRLKKEHPGRERPGRVHKENRLAAPFLEIGHEVHQRLDAFQRHGVVNAGAHSADRTMAGQGH